MKLLIPMPVKPGLSIKLLNKMNDNLYSLLEEVPDAELCFDYSPFPASYEGENYFARLGRMRQALIDDYLRDDHTDVLWIDADILEYPPTLPTMLRELSSGVISPLVLLEDSNINYDTAGMRQSYEGRSTQEPPYFSGEGPLHDMESVGCCVLVPADVHRWNKFYAQPDSDTYSVTEWWSICQAAKGMGYQVQCTTDIVVRHAELPLYGEAFH